MQLEKWSGVPSVDVAGSQEPEAEGRSARTGIFARAVLLLIRVYQVFFSPLNISSCRYHPTCSRYTYEAIEKFGARKGAWLGVRRVLRCHPFSPGGFDPVPDLDSASPEGHSCDEHSPEAHLRNNHEGHHQRGFAS